MALKSKNDIEIKKSDIDTCMKVSFTSMEAPDSPEWMDKEIDRLKEIILNQSKELELLRKHDIPLLVEKLKKRKWQIKALKLQKQWDDERQ